MNRRIKRKNAGLYLKQGFLSLVLLGITIYLGVVSPLIETLFPPTIHKISELTSAPFTKQHTHIKFHADKLFYTGYDNLSKGKVTGHYYYTIEEQCCLFLLLDTQADSPKETLTDYEGVFHLSKNQELYDQLTLSLAKDMDWACESMRAISLPMIASQPDYHLMPTIFLVIGLGFCTIVFGLSMLNNFLHFYQYKRHTKRSSN